MLNKMNIYGTFRTYMCEKNEHICLLSHVYVLHKAHICVLRYHIYVSLPYIYMLVFVDICCTIYVGFWSIYVARICWFLSHICAIYTIYVETIYVDFRAYMW